MLDTFLITLNPMLMMFLCIAIGFISYKTKILPENSGKVMSKLVSWIFYPALCFTTMARNFTLSTLKTHAVNLTIGIICVSLAISISLVFARFFAKKGTEEHGVYIYALAFANSGYMGDPIISALFGEVALSYYKLFTLPISLAIYVWGVTVLIPRKEKSNFILRAMNPPTIAMLAGMLVGITGIGSHFPVFINDTLDALKGCMGPMAMLVAGFTIAKYDMKSMVSNKKVYIATALRLIIIPAAIISILYFSKELLGLILNESISNLTMFLAFFAIATPLGLNTIVFPEAYGGNPKTGASMALISHTLCVITIPLLYMLMVEIFGPFTI